MMHRYNYKVSFLLNKFDYDILKKGIMNARNKFNKLSRGNYKHILVTIDKSNKCLEITLYSAISLASVNWLRSIQYFSKQLSKEPGLNSYICNRRLLKRCN